MTQYDNTKFTLGVIAFLFLCASLFLTLLHLGVLQ